MKSLHDALREACDRAGVVYKEVPADGRFHPVDIADDPHGKGDGRVKLFPDGEGGIVWNWKAGDDPIPFFIDDGRKLTDSERRERDRRREEAVRAARAEDQRRRAEAAEQAAAIWAVATPAGADHPYLTKKGVKPYGIRIHDGRLIVPVMIDGILSSLQYIANDGGKRFLPGGRIGGGFHLIGEARTDGVICIAEGYATAATIHEATGYPVAVAFDAGNLEPAAVSLRKAYPTATLIVCGDDDHVTPGNPGRTKAMAAAKSAGGVAVFPEFGADRPAKVSDFNDMSAGKGMTAVREIIETAATGATRRVDLVCGADIESKPIEWIWNGWIAAGKMHILAGAPGCGKTTLTMALAATVTSGGHWPDGSTCNPGNVVIWSGEDDPADTLKPRLVLSGADLRRVFFISGVKDGQETRPFDPASDIPELRKTLERVGNVRLLIVDPIVSAVAGDSHKNAEVRRDLQKLVDLAADIRCGLIGITHLTKGTQGREPLERVTGSLAFGALTRIAWFAVKPQPDAEGNTPPRLFLRVKSNIGPDNGGFEYDLCQGALPENLDVISSFARWGKPTDGDNRAIISDAEAVDDDGAGGSLGEAKRFLRDLLENGALTVKAIKQEADGAGLAWATIRRAQRELGIRPEKEDGRNGQWKWKLPGTCSTSPVTCSPKKHEHVEQVEQVTPAGQTKPGFHYGPSENGFKEVLFDGAGDRVDGTPDDEGALI